MVKQYVSVRIAKSRGTATLRHDLLIANNKTGNYDPTIPNKVMLLDQDGNIHKQTEFRRYETTKNFTADHNRTQTRQYKIYADVAKQTKLIEQTIRAEHHKPDPITGKKPRALQKQTSIWFEGIITFGNATQSLEKSALNDKLDQLDQSAKKFLVRFAIKENINLQNIIIIRNSDERQHHYHFLITMYNEKDRKPIGGTLNRTKLTQLQDLVGEAYAGCGFYRGKPKIERLKEGQKIQHKKTDEWLCDISKAQDTNIELHKQISHLKTEKNELTNLNFEISDDILKSMEILESKTNQIKDIEQNKIELSQKAKVYNQFENQLNNKQLELDQQEYHITKAKKELTNSISRIIDVVQRNITQPISKLIKIVLDQVFNIKDAPEPEKQLSLGELLRGIRPQRQITR